LVGKTRNAHKLLVLCFILLYCVVLALRGWKFEVARNTEITTGPNEVPQISLGAFKIPFPECESENICD
jgi:hypothetical protein